VGLRAGWECAQASRRVSRRVNADEAVAAR
jgi:hypothetical protein